MKWLTVFALLLLAGPLLSQPPAPERVGPSPDGGFVLNSGWTLRPAGRQIPLGTLPMSCVLSPDGKFLLVLNAGYQPPSISVLDAESLTEIGRTPVPDAWLGMAFTPDGRLLYVGGGSTASVFEFSFSTEGKLEPKRTFPVVPAAERTHLDFIGDVALTPDGRLIYAADLFRNQVVVINPQSGWVIERFKTARRPYRILFHPDGKSYYVTSWADGSVHHHETINGNHLDMARLGAQPMDMVWRDAPVVLEEKDEAPSWEARLFVAVANTNRVYVLGVTENKDFWVLQTIKLSTWPLQPLGMTPTALALSEDQSRLFVVCSGANAVAVVDVSRKRSRVLGFVPTGWYPTAARPMADGRLVVLNGRGGGSAAGQFDARRQTGTASVIDPFDEAQLFKYTKTVLGNSPYNDRKLVIVPVPEGNPVPPGSRVPPEMASPIKHVLYIVKENRSYDQVLGDLDEGNGEPSLAVFGEAVTPNHHKLAREFVLFDNFYVNGDVDADGRNWSTAAIAPAYVQRMWPNSYAGRRRHYDYEGEQAAAVPPAAYIWTNATTAGLSVRNYGFLALNHEAPGSDGVQVKEVRDPLLDKLTNREYRGFDLDYPDVERAKAFLRDLAEMEATGEMPRLMLMRLGNDHTSGTEPGKVTPASAVADNDYALGMIVEACSNSKFWPQMAIFVLEDDAQGGADHVDSHRSPAFIISPYARRGVVDSTMYNTTSMLRTIELILGLHPMTHFDAGATPMWRAFQSEPNPKPYTVAKPRVSLTERN